MDPNNMSPEPSSYKDADGFVFYSGEKVCRKLNSQFVEKYQQLKQNGVYENLSEQGFLLPFKEIIQGKEIYLESEKLKFISFPYEWGFEQMKTAALFQLDFIESCLSKNCSLKDASPYNIQFVNGKPVFIDILSLEPYIENTLWMGYRQFCEMFLAPLLLSSCFQGNWNKQLIIDIEGIPLDNVSALIPLKSYFNSLALFHVIFHARAITKHNNQKTKNIKIPKHKIVSILRHLKIGISELAVKKKDSNWTSYSGNEPYNEDEFTVKKQTINDWTKNNQYTCVLDIGANNTIFTEMIAGRSTQVISIDSDMAVADKMFTNLKNNHTNILPLHIDITQVSPSIGLNLKERKSFFERIKPDLTIALALIHHLFHSRNIPLFKIAELFSQCSSVLIIEFIAETDEMFLKIRNINNAHTYSKQLFEKEFEKYFRILKTVEIKSGKRFLYYMEKNKI